MAQTDSGASVEEQADDLDMFDEDTERTKKGWLQFYTSFGITYLDADGSFVAGLPNGKEVTVIDFDRAGLDETDYSYWLTFNWRSAKSRWGAWFGSWEYDAIGSRQWGGGFEIPVGASISTSFDAKWYIVEGTYSFVRTESLDAGIGFGFHMVDLDTTINTRIQIGDQEVSNISRQLDTLAPLPNVLAYLHWKFTANWHLVSRVGYFSLDYNQYSGEMTNAHALLNYELSPRWALGFGYQFVDLDLDVEKDKYVQIYDMNFSGPMAFVRFHF
ncbi:MAG: hypothetical protein GQ538_10175 [Xanthomonadales bacterium]|nr:hypothetical protein [Xanthomonadales bacterium]